MRDAILVCILTAFTSACDPVTFLESRVEDDKGRPMAAVTIEVTCGAIMRISAATDSLGRARGFTMGCLEDSCTLSASAYGRQSVVRPVRDVCTKRRIFCGCAQVDADLVMSPVR